MKLRAEKAPSLAKLNVMINRLTESWFFSPSEAIGERGKWVKLKKARRA